MKITQYKNSKYPKEKIVLLFEDDYTMHNIQEKQSGQVIHDAEIIIKEQEIPEGEEMTT